MIQKSEGMPLRYGPHLDINQKSLKARVEKTRPEIELLLRCAKTFIDPADRLQIKALLAQKIDWTYLLRVASRHGVIPLLYQSLHTTCPEAVPQAVLELLHHFCQSNRQYNFSLTEELLKLLKLFKAWGIRALPFKGPVLAAAVYGDISLRQFTDLDILVQPQDMLKATELLITQGYRQDHLWTRAQEVAHAQVRHHNVFIKSDNKVVVELHWRLLDNGACFPIELDNLWERLEQIALMDTKVKTFSVEDLLLFLCAHGSKYGHGWGRLSWIVDVAELIHVHQGLDWRELMVRASRLGSERRLLLGLCLASDLLGTILPEAIERRIQNDPMVKLLTGQVYERLFREADDLFRSFVEFRFHFRLFERWQDGIQYALISIVVKWAVQSRVGLLASLYPLIDRTRAKNVWLWPLPLFAILSFFHDLFLPIWAGLKFLLKERKNLSGHL